LIKLKGKKTKSFLKRLMDIGVVAAMWVRMGWNGLDCVGSLQIFFLFRCGDCQLIRGCVEEIDFFCSPEAAVTEVGDHKSL